MTSGHSALDPRIYHKQAKSLTKAGYDVSIIAQHSRDEVVHGIKIIALPKSRSRLARFFGVSRVVRLAYREKADAYHFHDPELLPGGLLLKRFTSAKVIYDAHEDYPAAIRGRYWIPGPLRWPAAVVFGSAEIAASWRMDRLVAATDSIAERFGKRNVSVIHNYPVIASGGIVPKPRCRAGIPTLVYAGGLSKERGITQVVEAMQYLRSASNARLLLYGWFTPESYEEVVRATKGFDRVAYMGRVKTEDMWERMSEASIGVVCFHPERNHVNAMPNKLFEYMAAGLPVVASNFPLWRQIVEGNNCGITVNPLKPEDIAEAIQHLIDHPDEAARMGANGMEAVLKEYNWEREGKQLIEIYEWLLR